MRLRNKKTGEIGSLQPYGGEMIQTRVLRPPHFPNSQKTQKWEIKKPPHLTRPDTRSSGGGGRGYLTDGRYLRHSSRHCKPLSCDFIIPQKTTALPKLAKITKMGNHRT